MEDKEDEKNEDGDGPIETAETDEGTTFEIPFIKKLISFGMTIPQALAIVKNRATNPNVFARLFTDLALMELFLWEPLITLKILVVERVQMFHHWLNERHKAMSLTCIDLDRFDDNVMASLVEAASRGSTARERSSSSGKDSSRILLPTFSGSQSQYKVWNSKWRAYLGNLKNADGIPLLYVVVHKRKERSSVRHQLRNASLKGSQFQINNFKVSQLLEIALVDGSANIFTAQHPGNGRRAYLDLDDQYAGSFCQETCVQEIMAKLKAIQYWGAKSFAWDKFTNVLLGYYVDRRTQVQNSINLIAHEKTHTIAAKIIATNKKAKRSLKTALACIGERMQLLGAMTSTSGEGGPTPSNQQIKKLKRKVKAFQKKEATGGNKGRFKGKDSDNYIPTKVLDMVRKASGDKGRKYVNYLLNGRKKANSNDKRFAKGVKRDTADGQDEECHVTFADDDAANDSPDNESASAAFGRNATNWHLDSPNKKPRKQGALHVVSYKISKTIATRSNPNGLWNPMPG
jgi:hypothetical protein